MEKFFKLKEHGTTVGTEISAGVTTFFTMAYILVVNPGMLAEGAAAVGSDFGAVFNGVFFATCIASFIGTFLMAVYAKIPFAQAPGMGLNAFFAYTVMIGFGYSYAQALGVVLISGILFVILTVTGLRVTIVKCIPQNVKIAISAGIGLFLAFLGLQNAGIVVMNGATLVGLINFSTIFEGGEAQMAVSNAIVAVVGLLIISVLSAWNIRGAILIGIGAATLLTLPLGFIPALLGVAVLVVLTHTKAKFATLIGIGTALVVSLVMLIAGVFPTPDIHLNIGGQFSDFMTYSVGACFTGLSELFAQSSDVLGTIATLAVLVISFSLVDMFDTIGTLLGTANRAGLLKKDGTMERMDEALLCDAVATTAGAMLGTSTITTFVESAAGIGEGGRTGLTSLTTSLLFLAALVLAPVVGLIPAAATAPALIYVGCLMIASIRNVEWDDITEAVPAFLTVAMMPLTYSIANGIAFGLISYVVIKACKGKVKEIHPLCAGLAILFVVRFFLMGM